MLGFLGPRSPRPISVSGSCNAAGFTLLVVVGTQPEMLFRFTSPDYQACRDRVAAGKMKHELVDPIWRQWHSCEHRAAYLLEAGLPITVQNLTRASSIWLRCGSARVFLLVELICAIFLVCTGAAIHRGIPTALSMVILCSVAIALKVLRYGRMLWNGNRLLFWLAFVAGFPGMVFPLLLERAIAIRRPTHEQLELTVAWLNDWLRQNPIITYF